MKSIGFIGVGIMGSSMVRNLMKAGYKLHIYARHPEKVKEIVQEGAILHPSIQECVQRCDVVITIVGYPSDVEEVYFSEQGILKHVKEGTYLIDMITSSQALAQRIYENAKMKNCHALDAPVTGGDSGAKNGTLTILVGGEESACQKLMPIFNAMGKHIYYCGKAGQGQVMKLANQIMIAATLSGVCEAISFVEKHDIDPQKMIDYLKDGAAGSRQLELLGNKIVKKDYAPGFFIKHFIKDMKLADQSAQEFNLDLSVLSMVLQHFEKLAELGYENDGTQRLIQYYQKD